jgi:hypothetical protein
VPTALGSSWAVYPALTSRAILFRPLCGLTKIVRSICSRNWAGIAQKTGLHHLRCRRMLAVYSTQEPGLVIRSCPMAEEDRTENIRRAIARYDVVALRRMAGQVRTEEGRMWLTLQHACWSCIPGAISDNGSGPAARVQQSPQGAASPPVAGCRSGPAGRKTAEPRITRWVRQRPRCS